MDTLLTNYIMHSGGADGSDTMWDIIGRVYGLEVVRHYYYINKTPRGNFPISNSAYEEGKCAVYRANNTLKRQNFEKYMFLLSRNWCQVKNSDAIYAIAEGFNGNTVKGGTGWAVQMAIDSDKDVFVFDQSRSRWFTYDIELSEWKHSETPVLRLDFAGIGTREIKPNGLKAIIDCYDITTKEITFDPIHMGHLYMITSALNDNLVDEVVVVPTMQNVWKDREATEFQHRCFMTQLAIDEIDNCTISSIDYYTPEPHYSYQTLQLLKEYYPNEELYLIVGADIVDDVANWKEGEWILENFKLIAVNRANSSFKAKVDGYISCTFDVSSTMIRYLVKDKKQIYPLVPKAISQYIHRFNLYKDE